jgi:hypothetical protein
MAGKQNKRHCYVTLHTRLFTLFKGIPIPDGAKILFLVALPFSLALGSL